MNRETTHRARKALLNPIQRLLWPRRLQVYGVGPPKSGTTSLARLFGDKYRSGHECYLEYTIDLAFKKLKHIAPDEKIKKALVRRDSWGRLEVESNALLIYFASELSDLFTDAKFICTVRFPRAWLRSAIDQHLNVSRADRDEPNARTLRPWLYDVLTQQEYPPEERPLADQGVWNLQAYLDFWNDHYRRALEGIPANRILFIRTHRISESVDRLARFLDVDPANLSRQKSHANATARRTGVLEKLDSEYVDQKIEEACTPTVQRLRARLPDQA